MGGLENGEGPSISESLPYEAMLLDLSWIERVTEHNEFMTST